MVRPKKKHLKHLKNKTVEAFVKWMEGCVRNKRITVYLVSLVGLVLGIVGIYQINISGSLIEDMPKNAPFLKTFSFMIKVLMGLYPWKFG